MTTTMTSPRLPNQGDTVDLVLDGFGKFGQADPRQADRQIGQYECLLRIMAFNSAEGWARDVTAEIAQEILALADRDFSPAVRDVVEWAG